MSYVDFVANLRLAKILLGHSDLLPEGPRERAAVWLAPAFMFGFRPAEFARLGPDDLRDLEAAVAEFRRVAESAPHSVTPEQYGEGAALLGRILDLTRLWRRGPEADEAKVVAALEEFAWPAWVVNWAYELKDDRDGDSVAKVTAYFDPRNGEPHVTVWLNLGIDVGDAMRRSGVGRYSTLSLSARVELLEFRPRAA